MIQKIKQNEVTFNFGMDGIIDSFDSENHDITDTERKSVINYSS